MAPLTSQNLNTCLHLARTRECMKSEDQEIKWTFPISLKWQLRWSDSLEVPLSDLSAREDVPPRPPHLHPPPGGLHDVLGDGGSHPGHGLHRWVEETNWTCMHKISKLANYNVRQCVSGYVFSAMSFQSRSRPCLLSLSSIHDVKQFCEVMILVRFYSPSNVLCRVSFPVCILTSF